MTSRIIYNNNPDQKLPNDIQQIVEVLDKKIPADWDIYAQPFLNNLKPDIVLLNEKKGIHIIECKSIISESFRRLKFIREEIKYLYCPRIALSENLETHKFPTIYSSHADLSLTSIELDLIIKNIKYHPIDFTSIASDSIEKNFKELLPLLFAEGDFNFSPQYAQDLRGWLRCSDFKIDYHEPLPMLDKTQQALVDRSTKQLLIKGSAGSGKTLVLALKAAKAISLGKKVLFLTFNLTLMNYIHSLTQRSLHSIDTELGLYEIKNFHSFARDFLHREGWGTLLHNLFADLDDNSTAEDLMLSIDYAEQDKKKDEIFTIKIPSLMKDCIDENLIRDKDKYDLILIDEGQDFHPKWLECTKEFLRDDGQLAFAYDFSQDIYKKQSAWPHNTFIGSGFEGRPNTLKKSYRLPSSYIPKIQNFHNTFLKSDESDINAQDIPEAHVQQTLNLEKCIYSWSQVDVSENHKKCVEVVLSNAPQEVDNFTYSNLLFLFMTKDAGRQIVKSIKEHGISVTETTHHIKRIERAQKLSFDLLNDPVKATTIHSAKGLESPLIVMQILKGASPAEVYTGLTRLRVSTNNECSIFVICSDPKYAEYGKTWDQK